MLELLEIPLRSTPCALGVLAALLLAIELGSPLVRSAWRRIAERPRLLKVVKALLRQRTKAGALIVAISFIEGLMERESPWNPTHFNAATATSLLLVAAGLGVRTAALGVIKKAEELASTGIYSACRHPLYLGTILIAFGLCVLFRDNDTTLCAGLYFLAFYPLTMAKEDLQNEQRFGVALAVYRASTPLILPLGRWRRAARFQWTGAASQGGMSTLMWLCAAYATAFAMVAWL